MAHTPRTQRQESEHDGRPCIHLSDEDGACLQVHARENADLGFRVSNAVLVPLEFAGVNLGSLPAQVDVYLTVAQAQELCDYFRSVL